MKREMPSLYLKQKESAGGLLQVENRYGSFIPAFYHLPNAHPNVISCQTTIEIRSKAIDIAITTDQQSKVIEELNGTRSMC